MHSNVFAPQTEELLPPSPPCPQHAEELFDRAMKFHRQDETGLAESLYRQVLSLCPEHVDACVYLGLLYSRMEKFTEAAGCFQRAQVLLPREPAISYQLGSVLYASGQHQLAIKQFKQTLAMDNTHWQAAYNLGTALLDLGNTAEAIAAYKKAASLHPQDPDIHFNLGLAHKKSGQLEAAIQAYLCTVEITPDDAEAHYNLALVYKELDCKEDAIAALEIAVALKPDFAAAHGNLGVLYLDQGRESEAIACYRQLLSLNHNVEAARHILAALTGETTAVAPPSYIADLFNNFSSHFEERLLVDLGYRTPWDLKNLLMGEPGKRKSFPRLLDLGCGTGLVGLAFRDIAPYRVGVDLSPKMIAEAEAKKLYDQLAVAEIVDFLQQGDDCFDLIVAADVLIYLGDLDSVLGALAKRLAQNGRILFSTEHLVGSGYRLCRSGRYAHSADYIRTVAGHNGLAVLASEKSRLRKEKEEWIKGELFVLGFIPA